MIRIDRAVIVEGKYDKITLENLIDATIIPTDGFGIFRDKEKCALLRELAHRDGIIVLTDSDRAGQTIRSRLKQICGDGKIIHVYVPQLRGKERRKDHPGKDGLLGVEGMSQEILSEAFRRSGVLSEQTDLPRRKIEKADLYRMGLSGGENSAVLRQRLLRYLELPTHLSANAFLDIINIMFDADTFERRVAAWRQEADSE